MKNILYIFFLTFLPLLVCLSAKESHAQQAPLMANYYLNRFIFNPAFTAAHAETQLHLMYRNQWAGLAGAPETMLLTYQHALPAKNMGLGVTIKRENLNLVAQTSALASYSYLVNLNADQALSFGLSLGTMYSSINWDKVMLEDLIDPKLYSNADQFKADGNFGVIYIYRDLSLGMSVQNLFARGASDKLDLNNAFLRYGNHSILSASYKLWSTNGDFTFEPILLYRFANNFPGQAEASVVIDWKEQVWTSLGYRGSYGYAASIGFRVAETIKASYAYEIANNNMGTASNGTHELTLSYSFRKKKIRTFATRDTTASFETQIDSLVVVDRSIPERYKNLAVGETVTLGTIKFGYNSSDLEGDRIPELDELARALKYNHRIHVEIGVHVDNTVDKNMAKMLTQKRAEAISKYLQANGAKKYQIAVTGYANSKPLKKNDDEMNNNRVEIMMLKKY